MKDVESFVDAKDEIGKLMDLAKSFKIPKTHKDRYTNIMFNAIFTINIAKEISRNIPIIKTF